MVKNEQVLKINRTGAILELKLNRPETLNALNRQLIDLLRETFIHVESDGLTKVIVVSGGESRAFCSGIDLKERALRDQDHGGNADMVPPWISPTRSIFEIVLQCNKPVICAINGAAVGGGLELALACDIRIAADNALMGLPEAKRGLGASFGSQMLARLMPLGKAYELLFTGDFLSAKEAYRWGIVNSVVKPSELMSAALACAEKIAANAPLSIARYKAAVRLGRELPLDVALRLNVGPDPYRSADRREGVRAFLEKRKPIWSGT